MKIVGIYLLGVVMLFNSCMLTPPESYFTLYKTAIIFDSTIYLPPRQDSFSILLSTNKKIAFTLPLDLPKWIFCSVDTLPNQLIRFRIQVDANDRHLPRKAVLSLGNATLHFLQKADMLLAQFLHFHKQSLWVDIVLQKDTHQMVFRNLPIAVDGAIFYPNTMDTLLQNYSIVSAVFKNKNYLAVDWWDHKMELGNIINLQDTNFIFAGGNGSLRLPYLVANPLQLDALRKKGCNPNRVIYFKQIKDIDLSEAIGMNAFLENEQIRFIYQNGYAIFNHHESGWIPIGDDENPFTGFFEGNHHSVDGLYIKNSTRNHIGLFGKINPSATIQHLWIGKNSFLYNHYNYEDTAISYTNMGSIAGENNGNIIQCTSEATLYSEDENNTGGIVGFNYGNVVGSVAKNIWLNSYVAGGIVGFNYGNIANGVSYNNHIVGNIVGGISGYNSQSINACRISSNRLDIASYGGSLVGYNSHQIIASYAIKDTLYKKNEEANIGLLAGFNNLSGNIVGCYITDTKNNFPLIGGNQNESFLLYYNHQTMTTETLFEKLFAIPYQEYEFQNPDATPYQGSTIWKNSMNTYPILWWE